MLKLSTLIVTMALFVGCVHGTVGPARDALPDGQELYYVQHTTEGEGVQVVSVDTFLCTKPVPDSPTVCSPYQHTAASGNSAAISVFHGAGTAVLGAAALGVPAAVLRPSTSTENVQQTGGGAVSTSESAGGAAISESLSSAQQSQAASSRSSSRASARARARQSQQQGQTQGQSQAQPAVMPMPMVTPHTQD